MRILIVAALLSFGCTNATDPACDGLGAVSCAGGCAPICAQPGSECWREVVPGTGGRVIVTCSDRAGWSAEPPLGCLNGVGVCRVEGEEPRCVCG